MVLRCKIKTLIDTGLCGNYCIFAQNSTKMKRFGIITALFLMLLGFSGKASAQFFGNVPDMKGKVTYGGDFDFGIYGNYLNFAIAPQVGYRIFNPWEVGVRGVYNLKCYFYYNEYYHYFNEYYHYFGLAPYTNFEIFRGLFAHAEYEKLYGMARFNHESFGGNWYDSFFVGGGIRSYSYQGSYYYIMLLYNLSWDYNLLLDDRLYPYGSPWVIRVGFCF